MKTATVRELRNQFASIAAWLEEGETVLLTRRGRRVGRIVTEPRQKPAARKKNRALYAQRFALLKSVPVRDLAEIVSENRGEQ